ncbi:hypothetical protein LG311_03050 [Sutcliffiella horikoshii]|uniref:hypothetical protein n=1 Tax=Sutcliffiella horikoshii TaxID=79883 RepID=UPI00384F8DCC
MNHKKIIFILSLVVAIGIAFTPVIGITHDNGVIYYGFPAYMFAYYGNGAWSPVSLGPFFNIAFFYVLFLQLYKLITKKKLVKNIDK